MISKINLWVLRQFKKGIYWLYIRFCKESDIVRPHHVSNISLKEVKEVLKDYCKPENVYFTDLSYGLTSVGQAKKFSKQTKVHYKHYIKDKQDCDEFSFALHSYWNEGLENYAFGIIWSDIYAFNFMIDHNKQIWVVEPQTNEWWKLEEVKYMAKYYPWRLVLL